MTPDADGPNHPVSGWWEVRRRVGERYRKGRRGRTRRSGLSRTGIDSDGYGRAHAVLRDAAASGCVVPKGQRHYWKSAFLKIFPDDVIELLIECASASPSPLNVIMIEVYRGAVARVANYATAFGHRDALFNLGILAISDNSLIDAE